MNSVSWLSNSPSEDGDAGYQVVGSNLKHFDLSKTISYFFKINREVIVYFPRTLTTETKENSIQNTDLKTN